jgi:predicted HTH transcriptional regulator
MKYLLFIAAGLAGVWLGVKLGRRRAMSASADELKELRKSAQKAVRSRIKSRQKVILEYAQAKGKVVNDEVESMFCVSDSTAGRYLDDLEKKGKLKQIGEKGKGVYYVPIGHLAKK